MDYTGMKVIVTDLKGWEDHLEHIERATRYIGKTGIVTEDWYPEDHTYHSHDLRIQWDDEEEELYDRQKGGKFYFPKENVEILPYRRITPDEFYIDIITNNT